MPKENLHEERIVSGVSHVPWICIFRIEYNLIWQVMISFFKKENDDHDLHVKRSAG